MAATKKTETRWQALVHAQEASGKSVREFAQSRGLSAASLYWWRSALGRRTRSRSKGPRLVEVALLRSSVEGLDAPAFGLTLSSGHRLRVPSRFDAESLLRLLSVLEGRC